MKAIVQIGKTYQYKTMQKPTIGSTDVLVKLKYAGLNRRDLYIPKRRDYSLEPLIIGSDGMGVIEEIGSSVQSVALGDKVLINPSLRWENCSDAPPKEFDILGMPDEGTLAGYIVINEQQVEKKPKHLSDKESSVLALSGLTGYRAMFTKGKLKKGETVFIPGAGSGVATFLIQFAKNIGARVIVSSRSKEKREKALKLGADIAVDTSSNWKSELQNEEIDLIVDSVGGATFNRDFEILKQGGRLVSFGATTTEDITINLRVLFSNQFKIYGSTMGSKEELKEMLSHMEKYKMKPVIEEVYDLEDTGLAFKVLKDSTQFGKISIKIE